MSRPKKNPDFVAKTCKNCGIEYKAKYYKRNTSLYCSKKCCNSDPDVINRIRESQKKTYTEKYNGLHPMQTSITKENFKNSIFNKYGVTHYSKLDEYQEKIKKTKLKKYGNENYNNIDKMKSTCVEKYGVDNVSKSDVVKEKRNNTVKVKHFDFIKSHCAAKQITPMFSEQQYNGYLYNNKYEFRCDVCSKIFETDVYKVNHIFCNFCNPMDKNTLETEIFCFIKSLVNSDVIVKRKDRTILNGKELDIYIPSKNIAFEFNGLYWHSENANNIKKFYHLYKSRSCIVKGIRLVHIFENEWVYKKEIVKSVISNLIVENDTKLYARNCVVQQITEFDKNCFLEKNHLQGKDKSSIKYGLYHNNDLVSVMTFVKSRFDKNIQYEMYRYCNKLGTRIVGGASKLFKHFVKTHNPISVVSYNDKRFFDGVVYHNLGFNFLENTPPNYWYVTPDYKNIHNRMKFQKHKLHKIFANYNSDLTEWENMTQNGYDRIWDCGNGKWVWTKPT
jgi:hypothetical protein